MLKVGIIGVPKGVTWGSPKGWHWCPQGGGDNIVPKGGKWGSPMG